MKLFNDPVDTYWSLGEALKYIREQQLIFNSFNFHLALAGSVLNKNESDNDLDIIVLGMHNDKELDTKGLFEHFESLGATSLNSKDYKLEGRILFRSFLQDKQIDWFIYDVVD